MNYEDFKQEIINRIRDFLPEKYADEEVSVHSVVKNNDMKLDGLVIQLAGSNIAPNIYLNQFFEEYMEGKPMDDILTEIAQIRTQHEPDHAFDVNSLTDFETVKEKINCRLVNADRNAEYLSDKPHTMMDDLAVTYHIEIGKSEQGGMSAPVTTALLDRYGIGTEELHETALNNMEHLSPASFKSMSETMAELLLPDMLMQGMSREDAAETVSRMFPPELDSSMYVLTNQEKRHGAAAILNQKIMDDITEKVGKAYYILPSSIHEVLIVPKREGMDIKDLESMVRDVNGTQVSPGERLSDHVYGYDPKTRSLFRADKAPEKFEEKKPSITEALKVPLPDAGNRAIKPHVAGVEAR